MPDVARVPGRLMTTASADVPLKVFARDDKSGTFDTFAALVLQPSKLKLGPNTERIEDSETLANAVASDPGGIGFIGLPYVGATKALAVADGDSLPLLPNAFTVATEDYPLARRLFLYTPAVSKNEK